MDTHNVTLQQQINQLYDGAAVGYHLQPLAHYFTFAPEQATYFAEVIHAQLA